MVSPRWVLNLLKAMENCHRGTKHLQKGIQLVAQQQWSGIYLLDAINRGYKHLAASATAAYRPAVLCSMALALSAALQNNPQLGTRYQALGVPCLPWSGACCLWPWTRCDPWGKKSESLLFQRYLTNVQAFFFFSFNKDLGFWGCISAVCGYSICCFSTELKYFLKMKLTSNFLLTFSLQGGIGLKMSKVQLILISKIHRPVKKEG